MKVINASIRATKRDVVLGALRGLGNLRGLTIVPIQTFDLPNDGIRCPATKMLKLELEVPDQMVTRVVDTSTAVARTGGGNDGDGHVVVSETSEAWRIADHASGDEALG